MFYVLFGFNNSHPSENEQHTNKGKITLQNA